MAQSPIVRQPEVLKDVAVVVTSHPRQQMFMRQGVLSWIGFPGRILLVYDDQDASALPVAEWTPPLSEVVCTGYPRGKLGLSLEKPGVVRQAMLDGHRSRQPEN